MFSIPTIFGISAGIISTLLAIFIARSYFLTKIKATFILFLVACFIALDQFLFAFIMSLSDEFQSVAQWGFIFVIILGILPLLCFISFLEFIEFGRIRKRIAFAFGLLTGAIFTLLFLPGQVTPFFDPTFLSWMINLDNYLRSIILVFGILIIYRIVRSIISIYRVATNERLKFQFKLAFTGIVLAIVGIFVVSLSGIIISNVDIILGTIIRGTFPLFISAGLAIAFIGFSLNPYSIYIISQKVLQIIVFNNDGITLFEHKFSSASEKQSTLIAGAIFGISSIMTHALGIESPPQSLIFPGRTLLFAFEGNLGFALISDQDSQILRNGLQNFSQLFIANYSNELNKWNGSIKAFTGASKFLKQSFPFLNVDEH